MLLVPILTLLFLFYVLTITPPPEIENIITTFGIGIFFGGKCHPFHTQAIFTVDEIKMLIQGRFPKQNGSWGGG